MGKAQNPWMMKKIKKYSLRSQTFLQKTENTTDWKKEMLLRLFRNNQFFSSVIP